MARFNFKIEEYDEGFRKRDEFETWITASNRLDAWADINKAYPSSKGYDITLLDVE